MPDFDYICTGCGKTITHTAALTENSRHLDGEGVCGTLRRDWKTINVNTANLRSARRG